MKIMKPIWNAVLSSLVTKAGTMTRNGASWAVTRWQLGQLGEQLEVTLAGLLEHEFAHRRLATFERLLEADLVGGVGCVGFAVDLVQRRPHHEQGEEQRQADHHLVKAPTACPGPGAAARAR